MKNEEQTAILQCSNRNQQYKIQSACRLSAGMRCDLSPLTGTSGTSTHIMSSGGTEKVTMSDQDVKDEMATEAEAPKAEEGMDEDEPKDSGSDLIGSAAMR